jgi:hypothetical protein
LLLGRCLLLAMSGYGSSGFFIGNPHADDMEVLLLLTALCEVLDKLWRVQGRICLAE